MTKLDFVILGSMLFTMYLPLGTQVAWQLYSTFRKWPGQIEFKFGRYGYVIWVEEDHSDLETYKQITFQRYRRNYLHEQTSRD